MNKLVSSLLILTLIITGCSAEQDKPPKVVIQKPDPQTLIDDLFKAVIGGDIQSVQTLVENPDTDLTAYDEQGRTALMRAAQAGTSPYIMEILIGAGAKIYQPKKFDQASTFLEIIDQGNQRVVDIVEKEKLRLATEVEEMIRLEEFEKANMYTKENFLPHDIILPTSEETPLQFAIKALSQNDVEGIKYIKNEVEKYIAAGDSITFFIKEGRKLFARVRNADFLDFMLKKISETGADINVISMFPEEFEDVSWIVSKADIIRVNGFKTLIQPMATELQDALTQLRSEGNKGDFFRLFSSLQAIDSNDQVKSLFTKEVLLSWGEGLSKNPDQLIWAAGIVDPWKENRQSAEPSGYSFDVNILAVVKGIEGKEFGFAELEKAVEKLSIFAPGFKNKSEESIKYLISSKVYSDSDKQRILEVILKHTKSLPDNIVSYALRHGGIHAVEVLLEADVPFNPESQSEAIQSALEITNSGDAAHTHLVFLNENKIPFDTEYGIKALEMTINKIWAEGNSTYLSIYDYLVSLPNSPITVMTDEQVVFYLMQLLKYVQSEKIHWRQLAQFADRIKNPIEEEKPYEKDNVHFGEHFGPYKIRTSFLWDFLMTAYEISLADSGEQGPLLNIFGKIASKFTNDNFSFSFVGKHSVQAGNLSPSQNLLVLSMLLSMSEEEILGPLKILPDDQYRRIMNVIPMPFSFEQFVKGPTYQYYSANKPFWKKVAKTLLKSGKTVPFIKSKSYILFAKILIGSGKINEFSEVLGALATESMTMHGQEKSCVLDQELYDQAAIADSNPSWIGLGSFEALIIIKDKSCSGSTVLSLGEVNIVQKYIKANLEPKPFRSEFIAQQPSIETEKTLITCREKFPHAGYNRDYSYDPSGTALTRDAVAKPDHFNPDIDPDKQCYAFDYNYEAAYRAKIVFIKNWYQCAVENSDDALIRVFEDLSTSHEIAPSSENEGIHFCRW